MSDQENPDSPVLSDGERSELEALRRWKRQATIVLDQWEDVWVSAGRPGRLGFSKPAAVQDEIARLRERARHV